MGEFIDMEIVDENSFHDTRIGNSRRVGGIPFEKWDRTPTNLEEGLIF
jgi:hypothetical protein